jgi:hypothetical protein
MQFKTFSINPSLIELNNYIQKNYPDGKYFSVYEQVFAAFGSTENYQPLLGIKNIVINPADVSTQP